VLPGLLFLNIELTGEDTFCKISTFQVFQRIGFDNRLTYSEGQNRDGDIYVILTV